MLNNTKIASASDLDFYHALTDNNVSRIVCLVLSIASIVIGIPHLYSLIWFEKFGSDKKRTILNMFVSQLGFALIGFLAVIQISETVRYIYGPLPYTVCYFQHAARNSFIWVFLLVLDANTATRYAFIFWLKNPAAFNDEFWCQLITFWIYGFAFITCFSWHFAQPFQTNLFYICCGLNSISVFDRQPKIFGALEILSFLLNITIYLRIKMYKRKPDISPQTRSILVKKLTLTEIEKESLYNFLNTSLRVSFLIVSTFFGIKTNSIHPKDFNVYPNYLYAYSRSHLIISSAVLYSIATNLRRRHYRLAMTEEIRRMLNL